jgi:hypothetical protein
MKLFMLILSLVACLAQATFAQTTQYYPLEEKQAVVWGQGYGENRLIRFPAKYELIIPTENKIWQRVCYSAGLQIRFSTNATTLIIHCTDSKLYTSNDWYCPAGANGIDLYARKNDGQFYWSYAPTHETGKSYTYALLPDDPEYATLGYEYCLYLPSFASVNALSIEVNDGAAFHFIPVVSDRKPIVFYGTSIINGAASSRSGNNITNIISRSLYDRSIVNLGFSGTGRMEPEVIRAINEIDAQVFVLDCLPNMGGNYISSIKSRYVAAVDSIKKRHPQAAIVLSERPGYANMEIYAPHKTTVMNVNSQLQAAYAEIRSKGYSRIYYLSQEALGLNIHSDFADHTHPNDKGMYVYAEKYLSLLRKILSETE